MVIACPWLGMDASSGDPVPARWGYGGNRRGFITQDAPTDFLQNLPEGITTVFCLSPTLSSERLGFRTHFHVFLLFSTRESHSHIKLNTACFLS